MKVQIIFLVLCWLHLTTSQPPPTQCPDGSQPVNCLVNPCDSATCPNVPSATCRANYCGGCNADFYISNRINVTVNCTGCLSGGVRYETGDTFTAPDGCNTCTCGSNGRAACTLIACPPPTMCRLANGTQVRAGQLFPAADGCNTCTCGSNGVIGCTRIACPPGCLDGGVRHPVGASYQPSPCTHCTCTTSGPSCLVIDCAYPSCPNGMQPIRLNGTCCPVCPNTTLCHTANGRTFQPGQTFTADDGCNTCTCTSTGNALCTLRACPPPTNTTVCRTANGRTFQPGQTFIADDGCNTCTCGSNGLAACTERACIGCVDETGVRRRIGEHFNLRNNSCQPCTCTTTGVHCAIVDCPPPSYRCQDGSQPVRVQGFCCPICPNVTVTTPPPNVTDVCAQTGAVSGLCFAYFQRYFYNATSRRCERFIYGGCGGNQNNFETMESCQQRCAPTVNVTRPPPVNVTNVCAQAAAVTGHCRGYFPRYTYNPSTQMCEQFIYGGCGGNDNNFMTMEECQQSCSVCYRPIYPPNFRPICDVVIQKWTYSRERRRCEQFNYSPCGETSEGYNVFNTEQECVNHCGGPTTTCTNGKVFEECGTACPVTCENRNDGPRPCPAICRQGCFCPQGMVEYNGGCVEPSQCPATTCTNGKVFEECGSACPLTCDNYNTPIACTLNCVQGCFCPRGMVQSNDQCVAPSDCPTAAVCTDNNGRTFRAGQRFRSADGCNTCLCTDSGNALCTERACLPVACNLKDLTVDHSKNYNDECSSCDCKFGQLNCTRRECSSKPNTKPTKVNMRFEGDLDVIAPTDDQKEDLKREFTNNLVFKYQPLGFSQNQIKSTEVRKGSIIFVITLSDADSTSQGANLTILLSQMQQHYMSGELTVQYNSQVLEPTGSFQVEEPEEDDDEFPWWGILAASIGGVVLVAIVVVLVAIIVVGFKTSNKRGTRMSAVNNHYVTYKAEEEDVDVKQPFY